MRLLFTQLFVFFLLIISALCPVVDVTSCSVISLCVNVWRVNVLFNKVGVTSCSGDEYE